MDRRRDDGEWLDRSDDRPPMPWDRPAGATAAGGLWIVTGVLTILNGVFISALVIAVRGEWPDALFFPFGLGIAFLLAGQQTLSGKTKGILGLGVTALVLGLVALLIGVLILAVGTALAAADAAGVASGTVLAVVALSLLSAIILVVSGPLALAASADYRLWAKEMRREVADRDRGRDDDRDDYDDRPRRRRDEYDYD